MVIEVKIFMLLCVSFVNVIPKLSRRTDLGNKGYGPVNVPALRYACSTLVGSFNPLFLLWMLRFMSSDMDMPRFGDMNPRSFGAKLNYASDSTGMPRFGDMNPRSFGAKLNYASESTGMPRFGDMNPRSFGAKLNYASDITGMPRFGDMNPRSFGAKLNYASESTGMPRFGDMNPRSFGAKLNYASDIPGMPRFGDMNPRSFGAKLNYASDIPGMPRFGDMNPRSFGAKQNNVTTCNSLSLATNMTSVFHCVRLNHTSTRTLHLMCRSSLIRFSSQNGPTSGVFEWKGRPFHQVRPQIATLILHTASHRSKGHNHRLLSALLHGPISTAGVRLAAVFRDQDFLSTTPEEMYAAHQNFSAPSLRVPSASHDLSGKVQEISDDQMIALGEQIFELCARLKLIKDDEYLSQVMETSLAVLQKRHSAWTALRAPQARQFSSLSSPSFRERGIIQPLPSDASGQFRRRTPEELDASSTAAARREMDNEYSASPASSLPDLASLSHGDMQFLQLSAGLFPVPVLGGWGSQLVFRSPALHLKAISELQQMDSVFDSIFFDLIERNPQYVQKAQLVTLKWRDVVPIGRATALWALLSLSETPPADTLRAGWLIQAIAAAINLKPAGLVHYLDTLHLVVENFAQVRGAPVCLPDNLELEAHSLSHNALSALFGGVAYSATAADQLYPVLACLVNSKSAIYRTVVSNPQFPLAGTQVLIPKTDLQAQQQPCAVYWNASKTVCLDRHHELNAHCNVDCPDASVQVLDTKWVFDLKVCPQTRMIDRFKARIVANGQKW
jgi:hypothetical protein